MESKRLQYQTLRKPDELLHYTAVSAQDLIEVKKVSMDGLFQINDKLWSKAYEIGDVNYRIATYEEQLMFFADYSQSLNSFDFPFKMTIFNQYRDMNELNEKILYPLKGDGFDESRSAYNDMIKNGIIGGKQGIEQKKYLTVSFKKENYEEAKVFSQSMETAVKKEFEGLGSSLHTLSGNERIQSIYNFFRMGKESQFYVDIEQCILDGRDWKNDVVCSFIDFNESGRYFRMDDRYCQALYIDPKSYPTDIDDELLYELSNLPIPGFITVDFIPIRKDFVKDILENKQMGIEMEIDRQQKVRNKNHNFLSDISYEIRKRKESLEGMRDDIKINDQKIFWTSITLLFVAHSVKGLESNLNLVRQICEKRSLKVHPFLGRQREGMSTALPLGGRYVSEMRGLFSRDVASFIPFNVQEYQDIRGNVFYYGKNRKSQNPILGNRKNLTNPSGFVFGVPGSGKSFTGSKMEIGSVFLTTQDDIIIIDPTMEYEDVVKTFEGAFISIDCNTTQHINPLHVQLDVFDDLGQLDTVIREKYVLMRGICAQCMENEFTAKHSSVIDRAIRRLFRGIATLPPKQRRVPTMTDFYDELNHEPDENKREFVDDVSISLDVFIDGSLNIFNYQTNVDVDNRVISYGIRDMDKELSKVAMLVILESIKKRVMDNFRRGKATWLYIDEFHMMLDSVYTTDFVVKFWKLVRKLGGICTGITQNMSLLMKDEELTSLISNSEFNIFLRQSTNDAAAIVNFFDNISSSQIKELAKASSGTGLIRFGNRIIALDNQMENTNPLYNIFNTNLHEKALLLARADKKKRKRIIIS